MAQAEPPFETAVFDTAKRLIAQLKAEGNYDVLPTKFTIAGGALANGVYNQLRGTNLPIRDIDVFIPSSTASSGFPYDGLLREVKTHKSLNLIEVTPKENGGEYDIEAINSFDINCCGIGVSFDKETKEGGIITTRQYDDFRLRQVIEIDPHFYNGSAARKLARYFDKVETYGQLDGCDAHIFNVERMLRLLAITVFFSNEPSTVQLKPKTLAKLQKAAPHLQNHFDIVWGEDNHVTLTPKLTPLLASVPKHRGQYSPTVAFRLAHSIAENRAFYGTDIPTETLSPEERLDLAEKIEAIKAAKSKEQSDAHSTRNAALDELTEWLTKSRSRLSPEQVATHVESFIKLSSFHVRAAIIRHFQDERRFDPVIDYFAKEPLQPLPVAAQHYWERKFPQDDWNILHEAAHHGRMDLLPATLLTKENLTKEWTLNCAIEKVSVLEMLKTKHPAAIIQLPLAILGDPDIISDEQFLATAGSLHELPASEICLKNIPPHRLNNKVVEALMDSVFECTRNPDAFVGLDPVTYAQYYPILKDITNPLAEAWLKDVTQHYLRAQIQKKRVRT